MQQTEGKKSRCKTRAGVSVEGYAKGSHIQTAPCSGRLSPLPVRWVVAVPGEIYGLTQVPTRIRLCESQTGAISGFGSQDRNTPTPAPHPVPKGLHALRRCLNAVTGSISAAKRLVRRPSIRPAGRQKCTVQCSVISFPLDAITAAQIQRVNDTRLGFTCAGGSSRISGPGLIELFDFALAVDGIEGRGIGRRHRIPVPTPQPGLKFTIPSTRVDASRRRPTATTPSPNTWRPESESQLARVKPAFEIVAHNRVRLVSFLDPCFNFKFPSHGQRGVGPGASESPTRAGPYPLVSYAAGVARQQGRWSIYQGER
ncbi:hypothetical protein BDK51DRAFT_48001 [Blyttiomyces helicus]|uniref:Uncharacterized protein n=1 Tax=Blyttiomyces helicus TaxID=388810 RepID=A0A4P9W7C3_9FUNG|nr:hypothetical protein BDK51DRAFT_48001 [Blyttiomyces helicus]|eukprot:RKO87972.1 hypothetical protein BDK51DRAFT_48001 [Blyttiomyces helicus]